MINLKLMHTGLVFLLSCRSVGGCSRPQGQVYEAEKISIHTYKIDGLTVRTGDLICTSTGGQSMPGGLFWKLFGELVYGEVDHIAVYVGPGGRCVEAGAKFRVLTFDIVDNKEFGVSIIGLNKQYQKNYWLQKHTEASVKYLKEFIEWFRGMHPEYTRADVVTCLAFISGANEKGKQPYGAKTGPVT